MCRLPFNPNADWRRKMPQITLSMLMDELARQCAQSANSNGATNAQAVCYVVIGEGQSIECVKEKLYPMLTNIVSDSGVGMLLHRSPPCVPVTQVTREQDKRDEETRELATHARKKKGRV